MLFLSASARQQGRVNESGAQIHLVLPDPTERCACFRALAARAPPRVIRSFASADDYLGADADRDVAGIVLFHWVQPGTTDGATLLARIEARPDIIAFVAANRLSIEETRQMLRGGARDLLPAPLDPRIVRRTIDTALDEWHARQHGLATRREASARLATLTPREHDILAAIAEGLGNKAIARRFDLSPRTVEVHRANIMRRAGAASVAELLRLQFLAELTRAPPPNPVHFGAKSAML